MYNHAVPHIHELIDFTVSALIVNANKILLIKHKKLNMWLPIGGHIELYENPEEALIREIKEETGLSEADYEILADRPGVPDPECQTLLTPRFLNIHDIKPPHRHVGMSYVVKAKSDAFALSDEHSDFGWFKLEELDLLQPPLRPAIRHYCEVAIEDCDDSWGKMILANG
jgi:8-oxo-dGTP diphosphatase